MSFSVLVRGCGLIGRFVSALCQFDEPLAIWMFEVQKTAQRPMKDPRQVRNLRHQIGGCVRQDPPGEPPATSTPNSDLHVGHCTDACVCPSWLTLR